MSKALPGALIVRADAGSDIGAGHVMRCLALALALRERGARVTFLGQAPLAIADRVRSEGFPWEEVGKPHPDPADLAATRDLLDRLAAAWLVLDGYHFTPDYQQAVREAGHRLLVVDDDARFSRYEADILLNQNLGAEALEYRFVDPGTRLFLGPRFALLRPEFARAAATGRPYPDRATRLLVTMGATDPAGGSFLALEALRRLGRKGLDVRIVAGLDNPRIEELRRAARELGPGVNVLAAVRDMAESLSWADAALSAAGSTTWEMCCLGLPMLLVVTAGNQRGIAAALHRREAAVSLGEVENLSPDGLAVTLDAFLGDASRRQSLGLAGKRLVDGRGAARVAAALVGG